MVNIWREREHEEHDIIALNKYGIVKALKNCGLLKYFQLSNMRVVDGSSTVPCSIMGSNRSVFSHSGKRGPFYHR